MSDETFTPTGSLAQWHFAVDLPPWPDLASFAAQVKRVNGDTRSWVPYLCALPGLPRRKLRKCQMRSYQRRKRLLLRKIARSDAADKAWRLV